MLGNTGLVGGLFGAEGDREHLVSTQQVNLPGVCGEGSPSAVCAVTQLPWLICPQGPQHQPHLSQMSNSYLKLVSWSRA